MRSHILRAAPKSSPNSWGEWPQPSLLYHMDGDNESQSIVDSGPNELNASAVTGALTTTSPKFGSAWYQNGASAGYIPVPQSSALNIGTQDFCIDFWCQPGRVAGVGTNDGLFNFGLNGSLTGPSLSIYNGQWYPSTSNVGQGAQVAASTSLQHIALTRSGTTVRFFINGVTQGSNRTWSNNFNTNQLWIATYNSTSTAFRASGRIDEFRVVIGDPVWTASFTPPTEPYPSP
jgi:hypothetical protein